MNILIKQTLEKFNNQANVPKILPHQLATIDYIFKKIFLENESILLFHKMGSGKTILALLTALLLAKEKKKIYIILLNSNIKSLWINQLNIIQQIIPFDEYNLQLINFITKKNFIDIYESIEKSPNKIKSKFSNSIFIIDEAHNFFGNTIATYLIAINKHFFNNEFKPLYLLVTGTPITNTISTLKDLITILAKPIQEINLIKQDGHKIYNFNLTSEGKQIIKKLLYGKVSYFNQDLNDLPHINYVGNTIINLPVIPCIMSEYQTQNYYNIKKNISNEMFLKYLLDISFTAMGNIENIYNFELYTKSKKQYQFTETLYFNKGKFFGEELQTLDNSCKLKYFVEKKIKNINNRCKVFIYFSNSKIGGRFLKDVLRTWGIQEYGKPKLDNYMCYYCNDKKLCKICKPMTYIIITSIYLTTIDNNKNLYNTMQTNDINKLLDIYNLPNNDNGEEIIFLFGSKIISESYTLKETKEIWFLTIPDSITEISQIISRCIRTFSYKNINISVNIYILMSVTNDFNYKKLIKNKQKKSIYLTQPSKIEEINKYIHNLNEEDNKYPFDFKKILYLEIKSKQINEIYDIFKKCSLETSESINPNLINLFIIEILRRYTYFYNKFTINKFINIIPKKLINQENIIDIINNFITDGIIIYNQLTNQSFIIKKDNYLETIPIILEYKPYLIKIAL